MTKDRRSLPTRDDDVASDICSTCDACGIVGPLEKCEEKREDKREVMPSDCRDSVGGVRGGRKNRVQKRKHQITYLAELVSPVIARLRLNTAHSSAFQAKAREEQLQDKWADNRYKKQQSRKRYGF